MSVETRLAQHLTNWGLREFSHEDDYYAWQRQSLSAQDVGRLNELAQKRQGGADHESDREFYDLASSSTILPVLYSQRFDYYRTVGAAISQCLSPGKSVLDFGCGVGILTTWYASIFPDCMFIGIDRSSESIETARQHAEAFGLKNVSFQPCIVPSDTLSRTFDVIIATQALFQTEADPGIPSRSWKSFEREDNLKQQTAYEIRTGMGERLDWLLTKLSAGGRLLVFEKAHHLGRRVPFQRALAKRGLCLNQEPMYLGYSTLGEYELDGPLYSMTFQPTSIAFDEYPFKVPLEGMYRFQGKHADWIWSKFSQHGTLDQPVHSELDDQKIQWQLCRTSSGLLCGRFLVCDDFIGVLVGVDDDEDLFKAVLEETLQASQLDEESRQKILQGIWPRQESNEFQLTPLYENHSARAQSVWERLSGRVIIRETTRESSDGQQYHVELGRCAGQMAYLYWANTFDQRQIVVMEEERESILEEYFLESDGED